MKKTGWLVILFCVTLIFFASACRGGANLPVDRITLPAGFKISVYADNVPGARSLAMADGGTVFVGTRGQGKVYALIDRDKDNKVDEVLTIADGLFQPNGVAIHKGALYVAEINRVLKFPDIENNLRNIPAPVVVNDTFPSETHHGWKFIRFGPDGLLYVPVGAPCNICESKDNRFASIMRMKPDGSDLEIYAEGIRNTVGFDWHTQTGELWFTDNGRDWMGENAPPDELNVVTQKGQHFGYPYIHGNDFTDTVFWKKRPERQFSPPAIELGPHVAALGMRFYTGTMFPEQYQGQIFIAEHGSWNRLVPIGYRVMLVRLKENKPASYEVFAEGWLRGLGAWGRPVDVMVMPDGALLVSDDKAGAVYRISYEGKK